jgi:hypothetical protein
LSLAPSVSTSSDEDITTNDTSTPTPVSTSTTPLGPITRARALGLPIKEEASRRLDSDYRTDTICDGRHDFIRTPFWLFKYFLESLSNLLSKGIRITSISIRSQPQSLIYHRVLFSHGAASPYFGPMGCVSS